MKQKYLNKKGIIIALKVVIVSALLMLLIRGLFFEKEVSFAIAQESNEFIPDLIVKVDNQVVFNDTIYRFCIPCCSAKKTIDFGIHEITIESESKNLKKEFKIIGFRNTHIFIAVWETEKGELWIEKEVFYFLQPMYS